MDGYTVTDVDFGLTMTTDGYARVTWRDDEGNEATDVDFGLTMTTDGYARVTWRDDEGNEATADLDSESPDVKDAVALIRKIIWGQ